MSCYRIRPRQLNLVTIRPVRATRAPSIHAVRPIHSVLKGKLRHLVGGIQSTSTLREDLTGRAGIAGRHIHDGVVGEEVPRPQQQRDRLHRHDGEVLGGWNMRDAERVP